MEYVKGRCHTNLDNYDVSEITSFYRVPLVGEKVYCRSKGYETTLKVCSITHSIKNGYPFIYVELHH